METLIKNAKELQSLAAGDVIVRTGSCDGSTRKRLIKVFAVLAPAELYALSGVNDYRKFGTTTTPFELLNDGWSKVAAGDLAALEDEMNVVRN